MGRFLIEKSIELFAQVIVFAPVFILLNKL